jgi:hypothetical protein
MSTCNSRLACCMGDKEPGENWCSLEAGHEGEHVSALGYWRWTGKGKVGGYCRGPVQEHTVRYVRDPVRDNSK